MVCSLPCMVIKTFGALLKTFGAPAPLAPPHINKYIHFLLSKYYNKRKTYFAHDALEQCTVGDVVLLKALPEKRSKHVKHELSEIVYKVGRVVDPLTGKRVAGKQYLEPLTESTEDAEVSLMEKLEQLNITASSPPSPPL